MFRRTGIFIDPPVELSASQMRSALAGLGTQHARLASRYEQLVANTADIDSSRGISIWIGRGGTPSICANIAGDRIGSDLTTQAASPAPRLRSTGSSDRSAHREVCTGDRMRNVQG